MQSISLEGAGIHTPNAQMGIHNAGALRVHEARAERDGELDMAGGC